MLTRHAGRDVPDSWRYWSVELRPLAEPPTWGPSPGRPVAGGAQGALGSAPLTPSTAPSTPCRPCPRLRSQQLRRGAPCLAGCGAQCKESRGGMQAGRAEGKTSLRGSGPLPRKPGPAAGRTGSQGGWRTHPAASALRGTEEPSRRFHGQGQARLSLPLGAPCGGCILCAPSPRPDPALRVGEGALVLTLSP